MMEEGFSSLFSLFGVCGVRVGLVVIGIAGDSIEKVQEMPNLMFSYRWRNRFLDEGKKDLPFIETKIIINPQSRSVA